jgi:DNA polymerase-3 subunit epsilon
VNIEVFKYLAQPYKTLESLYQVLSKPIEMKTMPLGKHKGRVFKEIPLNYLKWAIHQDFDQDLIHSIKNELKKRNQGNGFNHVGSAFSGL